MKKSAVEVKQNAEKPVAVEVMAESIVAISDGVRRLRAGALNDRALDLSVMVGKSPFQALFGQIPCPAQRRRIDFNLLVRMLGCGTGFDRCPGRGHRSHNSTRHLRARIRAGFAGAAQPFQRALYEAHRFTRCLSAVMLNR